MISLRAFEIMPETLTIDGVETAIHHIGGQRVMMDSDLAKFYGVTTKVLNQAVRRNKHRFPVDFAFQLTSEDFAALRSQIVTSNTGRGGRRFLPWVFTEHGAVMLASVINSAAAIEASVQIVRAFVKMHKTLSSPALSTKLMEIEMRLGGHDADIATLLDIVRQMAAEPQTENRRKEIGFHTLREEPATYRTAPKRRARKEKK